MLIGGIVSRASSVSNATMRSMSVASQAARNSAMTVASTAGDAGAWRRARVPASPSRLKAVAGALEGAVGRLDSHVEQVGGVARGPAERVAQNQGGALVRRARTSRA